MLNFFPFYSNELPALVAKGFIPPYAALVQSPLGLAICGKIFLLQTITVLCADGRVK